jgi:Asp/Glu/hydantoin racemase
MSRIIVVNPNSNAIMTAMIDRRLDVLRRRRTAIECLTLEAGPPAIENAAHSRQVIAPLCARVAALGPIDAVVIACFSDPGLAELRALMPCPVLGFCESGVRAAIGQGGYYGILTNLDDDIPDEIAYLHAHHLADKLASIEAIGIPVRKFPEHPDPLTPMAAAVEKLRKSGASSVVLGCAGFSAFADQLGQATGMKIVDPTIAAVEMAIVAAAG